MHSSLVRTPTLCALLAGESTSNDKQSVTALCNCIQGVHKSPALLGQLFVCCCFNAFCLFEVRFVLFASSVWSLAPVAVAVASDAARLPLVGDKTLICCNSRIASLVARPVVQIKTMRGKSRLDTLT